MAWKSVTPNLFLRVWPGEYRALAPVDENLDRAKQTELSVQCLNLAGESSGPVYRFSFDTPFIKVWEALIDFRLTPPELPPGTYGAEDVTEDNGDER